MADEMYKSLLPTSVKDDKLIKGKFRQRNELHKYIIFLQGLDKESPMLISEIKNISAILFSNLHGIRLGERQVVDKILITPECLTISDQKYSRSCLTYIREEIQINGFNDFLYAISSIKDSSKEIPKEIIKLKVLKLCLKWWNQIFLQQPQYKSAVELAKDFVDVMEILWWYLKFDYCPAVCFNKILAKHSLNEMVLPQPQGNYFPVMDYSIVFEENTFSSFDEAFISMLKYNQLFSDLPNNSGCCKTIARDFIKDNIATFEYLLDPSNENRDNAINQLRNKKYDVINPKIQAKMESYDAKTKEIFIRCLTFRKRVIAQRREMINKYYDIRKKNEYFNFSFVQSGSLNNNQIDDAVAKSGIQTANQRCKTADKSMQTEHIFDDDDCCSNNSEEEKMDVDNIGGIELVSTPSILKPLGSSRKSRRILEKAKKDTITAAEIPNLRDASEAADDDDRDEIISNSEGYKCFKNSNVHTYLYACESKFKGDTHNALYHLAKNGYSIKKALENIDLPASLPMKYIQCNLGIWNKREMQTFVQVLSDNYQWNSKVRKTTKHPDWLKIIRKNFLNKSPENCSNFYYTLKSAGLSFRNQTFKQSSNFFKSTSKPICENCINKLWKQSNQNQKTTNLCALCKLYLELYVKQRPNAQALSESFDLSFLSSKKT